MRFAANVWYTRLQFLSRNIVSFAEDPPRRVPCSLDLLVMLSWAWTLDANANTANSDVRWNERQHYIYYILLQHSILIPNGTKRNETKPNQVAAWMSSDWLFRELYCHCWESYCTKDTTRISLMECCINTVISLL